MLKINKFLLSLIIGGFLIWPFSGLRAQSGGSDAIAVRIVPNPNHYSITRWYESQGFQGAPQLLKVDGYEAIRDGRTVYVNAANIENNKIYTNIYLISYNQNPGVGTGDILGQIIARWKFNNNLSLDPASCSISNTACKDKADCGSNQKCSAVTNSCELETSKNCLIDTDCPINFFCDSLKAKIGRDVIRVGHLEDLKQALENYNQTNSRYPTLGAGTYLAGQSLSVWPSWNQTFLTEIAASPALTDPINRLGVCSGSGFDPSTCWNAETKQFSDLSGTQISLPNGSRVFYYAGNESGSKYDLCGTIETGENNYQFEPMLNSGMGCAVSGSGIASNTAPVISDKFLLGEANTEFVGYIKAYDSEGDPLRWELGTSGINWSASGWSAAPKLEVTSNPGQARISAQKSGNPGSYNIQITVTDNRGGRITTTTPIKISNASINISADDVEYTLDPTIPFKYSFTFSGRQLSSPSNYSLNQVSNIGSGYWPLSPLTGSALAIDGIYQVNYSGIIPTSTSFVQNSSFKYRIDVSNITKEFNIKIKSPAPVLDIKCLSGLRTSDYYECLLGPLTFNNQKIKYSVSPGLAGNSLIVGNKLVIDKINQAQIYNYTFKATNEYGASSTQPFTLKINNYCGDGIRQIPNTEGRGGIYNDGYEDCDINSGVTNSVINSKIDNQYACRTVNNQTPNPILTSGYCVYKSPFKFGSDDVGGYCGDGYCQITVNGRSMENVSNCKTDCDSATCVPDCSNKVCGSDGCGGTCGQDCSQGFCSNGQCQTEANLHGHTFRYLDSLLTNINQPIEPTNGVTITIRDQSLAVIATTSTVRGNDDPPKPEYNINIPGNLAGNYEITASCDNCGGSSYDPITKYFTKDELINNYLNSTTSLDFIFTRAQRSPSYQANLKIMLVWGSELEYHDSVLSAGTQPDTIFINAANESPYSYMINGEKIAALDRNNPGTKLVPENMMIYQYPGNGNFQYYVNTAMVNGNCSFEKAKVYVFDENNNKIKTYNGCAFQPANPSVPVCPSWYIFKIDGNGAIIENNNCENISPPANPIIGDDPDDKEKKEKEKEKKNL